MKRIPLSSALCCLLALLPIAGFAAPVDTLVGYWKMESTNGPAVLDSAPGGSAVDDGTWVGTPTYGSAVFGEGMILNGSQYLSIPDSIDTDKANEDLTISTWIRVDVWDTNWQCVISKGEQERYRIARRSNDANQISYAGGTGDIFGGDVTQNPPEWHNVVAVSDHGVQMRLYVDGVRVATGGAPVITDDNRNLLIGENPAATNRRWKGGIDDVGIFDEAFDDTFVATLYALATDPKYLYDLGKFNQLRHLHACGAGAPSVMIGTIIWDYAAADPADGRDFFRFGATSGVVASEGPPINAFTATPQFILNGESSLLEWEVNNFDTLTIDDGAGNDTLVTLLSDLTVMPAATTTYTLTAENAVGTLTSEVTVFVDTLPTIESFTATDDTLASGEDAELNWETTGADTLSIDMSVGDVSPGSGSIVVPNVTSTTTYTLTATNAAGSVTETVTVDVGAGPVINSFTTSDANILPGGTANLNWDVDNADTVSISPAIGEVSPTNGTACDNPAGTTTYTLTATNGFGVATATVTISIPTVLGIDGDLWTVQHATANVQVTTLAIADAVLAGTNQAASVTVTNVPVINYGPGASGEFPNDAAPPLGEAIDDFALKATATLIVNFDGTYTFGINNDDGGRLRIDGNAVIVDDALHGPTTSNGVVSLTAGTHTIEYVYFERGGGQAGEVFYVNADGVNELIAVSGAFTGIATTDVIINEFMADNTGGLLDAELDTEDWIELYNGSGADIDLAGYYLTDDAALPNKWAFPTHMLPDEGYLVVFASDKDTTFGTDEFHTNFKLTPAGEYLGLYKDDGGGGFTVVSEFAPTFPPQFEDVSYGTFDTEQYIGYFSTPTPGRLNTAGVDGFLGDTSFTVDRGLFDTPFDVEITTTEKDSTIRYTTDGSTPTINTGTVYSGPITIGETTVLRAAAFKKGFEPTNVDTQTYLFLDDVLTQDAARAHAIGFPNGSVNGQTYQYGMSQTVPGVKDALECIPTISLVMDQRDFSSSAAGIFSNPGNRGRGWERPGSIELINEDGLGTGQFQTNCGVRIRGGFSRSGGNPKHAFRFFFRPEYDGDLRYPIFQEEGTDDFEKLDLRTSQNYSWAFQNNNQNTFLREVSGRDAQREMGQPYTRSRYYHLYINGQYWGLFMTQERAEKNFGETYLGGDKDNYDVIKSAGNAAGYTTEATDGELDRPPNEPPTPWRDLWTKVRAIRSFPTDNARYFALQGLAADGETPLNDPANPNLIDIDNLIDYLLAIFYTGNYDAPLSTFIQASNNWFGMRDRSGTEGFKFFVHDGEHSLGTGGNSNNRVGPWNGQYTGGNSITNFNKSNPQYMHEDLAWNAEYRIRFADRIHKHMIVPGGALDDDAFKARLEARATTVQKAIAGELARWGNGRTEGTWLNAKQDVINFVNAGFDGGTSGVGRAQYVINFLRNYNDLGLKRLYPTIDAPVFSTMGGIVPVGTTLTLTNPNVAGDIYFTQDGSDPREVGGAINPDATQSSAAITLNNSRPVRARIFNSATSEWSAICEFTFVVGIIAEAGNLVISEIHYNPDATVADTFLPQDYEFIELLNISETDTIELSGVEFIAGITFDFSSGSVSQLAPGERVVIVNNAAAFAERYPAVDPALIAGEYEANLDNGGEQLTLLDANGAAIVDFAYNDRSPWPTSPDGEGYSLVLNCDVGDPDHGLAINWRSHGTLHGNPGGPDGTTWADYAAANGLSGIPGDDNDLDLLTDLGEYGLGTDPNADSSQQLPSISIQGYVIDGVPTDFVTLTYRRNLAAGDLLFYAELSTNLVDWSFDEDDIEVVEAVNQGDGTELITVRAVLPFRSTGKARCYLRLRIEGK